MTPNDLLGEFITKWNVRKHNKNIGFAYKCLLGDDFYHLLLNFSASMMMISFCFATLNEPQTHSEDFVINFSWRFMIELSSSSKKRTAE